LNKWIKDLALSALAGMSVALGGVVFLSCENKVIGSMLFSIGLFMVCSFGFNLFTGKVCYCAGNPPAYIGWLGLVWFGNLIGAQLTAWAIGATRIGSVIAEKAAALSAVKTGDGLVSLFILGIFCNMMIYVGVESYKAIPYEVGKYVGMVLCIMVFILSGYEHCVADMFYFAMGNAWSAKSVIALVVITLGNSLGGLMIPFLRNLKVKE